MKVTLDQILKLGNPDLYLRSEEVKKEDLPDHQKDFQLLFALIKEFKRVYGDGRGIAAPQAGILKRFFCLILDGKEHVIINPRFENLSEEMFEELDWCMSFPCLKVKVLRHRSCRMIFRDPQWNEHTWEMEGDLSQLVQHEYDHLDGILATMKAIDNRSFSLRE